MPGDRTVSATPARLRRGWRAGLRGQSRWLDTAAGLAAVGLVVGAIPWSMASGFGARWQAALANPAHASGLLRESAVAGLGLAAALAAAFLLGRILSALLAGRLGLVDRGLMERIGAHRSTQGTLAVAALAVIGTSIVLVTLRGVLAGAARSVDATAAGTWTLWTTWPHRTWTALLITLAALGWAELLLSQRRVRARLAQTPEQARDDRRSRGGRR